MEKLLVIGSGGHARSVVDSIESACKFEIAGFVGPDNEGAFRGYSVICDDDGIGELYANGIKFAAFGIGYLGGRDIRRSLYSKMKEIGFAFPPIIDPSAAVALDADIGNGAYIGKNAVVNSGARVGLLSIVNSGAVVEHDCMVGNYSHISVNSAICGASVIGDGAFVGAGAVVIQSRKVGDNAIIGAGSTVLSDVPDDGKALGLYDRR